MILCDIDTFSSLTIAVFFSVLCDNLLLTIVVPILPELLREKVGFANKEVTTEEIVNLNNSSGSSSSNRNIDSYGNRSVTISDIQLNISVDKPLPPQDTKCLKELFHLQMLDEDSKLGILLSTKALMQLLCNPFVGTLVLKFGYKLPLCIGNFILCLCSLAFGFADSYILFLIARTCHGLASSLVAISGMALVAELYQRDEERTNVLGKVMGSAALGVLIGYPFGGFSYAFIGRSTPFLIISTLALINTGFFASKLRLLHHNSSTSQRNSYEPIRNTTEVNHIVLQTGNCCTLLHDKSILVIFLAIWFSTMAMSILEPTLPVWLIENIDPPKWQLGLVFVPDSLGYFLGTSFFGPLALQIGRWKTSMISMGAIGLACFVLPMGKKVWQLALPHFALGLGLGVVDASLMPLLARITDEKHHVGYGTVYALAQTSVALAYSIGPLIGGQLIGLIGFPDLIRSVGFLNLLFSPFNLILTASEEEHNFSPTEFIIGKGNNETSTTSSGSFELDESERKSPKNRMSSHLQIQMESLTYKWNVQPKLKSYKQLYNEFDSD